MARKLCTICEIRTQNTGNANGEQAPRLSEMCNPCYAEGGWENTHNDGGHDEILAGNAAADNYTARDMEQCWICHPELNLATRPAVTGHTNTVAKTRTSHAACKHNTTPTDRAACRKANTWNGTAWV